MAKKQNPDDQLLSVQQLAMYLHLDEGTVGRLVAAGKLPGPHRDPFDRMLMAQAVAEGMQLVSNDRVFREYNVNVLW